MPALLIAAKSIPNPEALALGPTIGWLTFTCALALVAIPACLIDFHPNAEGLHGLVRAFPAGACLSAMAIGFMARRGKL